MTLAFSLLRFLGLLEARSIISVAAYPANISNFLSDCQPLLTKEKGRSDIFSCLCLLPSFLLDVKVGRNLLTNEFFLDFFLKIQFDYNEPQEQQREIR
jgi:hypothetical protein